MQYGGIDPARTADGLTVNGHHIRAQRGDHAAHLLPESGLELGGIDQSEQTSEGVVRRDTVDQTQITAQPILLLTRP